MLMLAIGFSLGALVSIVSIVVGFSLATKGKLIDIKRPLEYSDNDDSREWVKEEAKRRGIDIKKIDKMEYYGDDDSQEADREVIESI